MGQDFLDFAEYRKVEWWIFIPVHRIVIHPWRNYDRTINAVDILYNKGLFQLVVLGYHTVSCVPSKRK